MTQTDNAKPEAIPPSWVENPIVKQKTYWFKDDGDVYPKDFLEVNGALIDPSDADELVEKVEKAVQEVDA